MNNRRVFLGTAANLAPDFLALGDTRVRDGQPVRSAAQRLWNAHAPPANEARA